MPAIPVIIIVICGIAIGLSDYFTKDPANPIEQIAEKIIEKEIGK
ncbi:MAG: hypothetical protein V4568_17980 [Pseudomonadota bacterium]